MRIKIFLSAILLLLGINELMAQIEADSGSFIIHKFQQPAGKERYSLTKTKNARSYAIRFNYVDRGMPVDLVAALELTPSFDPLSFRIKGGTSRFSTINDSVVLRGKTVYLNVNDSAYSRPLPVFSFPIAGYAPATVQRLLLQYWEKRGKPDKISTLPFGEVHIQQDGNDTLILANRQQILRRFVIKGLIWGNEFVWTNAQSQLICLITIDAEGDNQEIVAQPYQDQLPFFINKAATYSMRLFAKSEKSTDHRLVAITGGCLIDVRSGVVTPNATVILENGKISYAGPTDQTSIPTTAFVIDARGKSILPGLWDMHAHFQKAEWGPAYLAAGVTTVRDCGNEFDYINAIKASIDQGAGVGPHILKAGIIDGKGPKASGIILADTKREALAAVRRYKENGFVQIKIYSSVKPAIVKIICEEAHRLGLSVTGHVPIGMTLTQAVDSGMNMINHLSYVHSLLKRNPKTYEVDFSDSTSLAIIGFIKSHQVVIDPTLGVFELGWRSLLDDITDIEPAFATLPAPLKPIFMNTGTTDNTRILFGKKAMKSYKQLVYALYQAGVPIVAGTDMGFPGYSLYRELELYVDSGLTPLQAIQTATIIPATVMKLEAEAGSIEKGKRGDIILVDGDPLADIHALRRVTTVFKDGKLYDSKMLHRLAEFTIN